MYRLIAVVCAVVTIVTVGNFAFGQGEGADNQLHPFAFLENLSMVIMPNGHGMRRQIVDPAMTDAIMKNAKPMAAGMIFFMHDGKMYMTKDEQVSGGRTLSAMIMHPAK